ncbi:MAG: MAE_28990/MAE_18760 family HEPN-like nuclease [Pirellulaceae bacterium]
MDLDQAFSERLQEIEAYIDLLEAMERQLSIGPPHIGGSVITVRQQRILYSSVYLQLYNLIEATATWCLGAVAQAASSGEWRPLDLSAKLRREWVKGIARTSVSLNEDHRLEATVSFCNLLLKADPIAPWDVVAGGGGNWDDSVLEAITERLGCELAISPPVKTAAKRVIRDDRGSLALVKHLRNKLAHGEMSFEECGNGVTVADLKDIKDRTANYLREVVASFNWFIEHRYFIDAERRPYVGEGI